MDLAENSTALWALGAVAVTCLLAVVGVKLTGRLLIGVLAAVAVTALVLSGSLFLNTFVS